QGDVFRRWAVAVCEAPTADRRPVDPHRSANRIAARLSAHRTAAGSHRPRRGIALLSHIRIVERTGSTNADLLADNGAQEGDWLVALTQDAGRGRQGRNWQSADGNFFGSTLVNVAPGDPSPTTLSLAAGLALIEATDQVARSLPLQLKWPNDLMLAGA